jgi:cell division protein FtsW
MIIYPCLGVLLVLSASSVSAVLINEVSPYYFFFKQLTVYIVSFLIGFLIVSKVNTKSYKHLTLTYLMFLIVVLIGLLMYGKLTNNAKSWFDLGFFSFQPSEFIKLALILYFGTFFGDNDKIHDSKYFFLIPIMFSVVIFFLIGFQPDLGTAAIIALIAFLTFMAIPLKKTKLINALKICAGAVGIIIVVFLITNTKILNSMQIKRFTFKEPCTRYSEETGYQACNGFIAINKGGLFGKGIGNSSQKYLYLPEAHKDFIFPIAIEELGLIFGIGIILGYIWILQRIFKIAKNSYNLRNSIICYGIMIYVLCHIVINLTGILALMPLTGVPLPFLSYGGSFTFNLVISMFIVQRIAIENNIMKNNIEIAKIAK